MSEEILEGQESEEQSVEETEESSDCLLYTSDAADDTPV